MFKNKKNQLDEMQEQKKLPVNGLFLCAWLYI